jgi:enoyl-[acyl-carrier protein] reductase I
MGLLDGKNALIFGVANKNSIAWGITQALHQAGATIGLSYAGEVLKKRVTPLAESIGVNFLAECDVNDDAALDSVFSKAEAHFGKIDILIHAVAYATREDLEGDFVNTSRAGWTTALNTSAYSLVAMAARARKLMPNGGSIIALSYYASQKVFPHYNIMGVAKAALEASARHLAYDLGGQGIRVNVLSPGPIKTLSAAGIPGLRDMLRFSEMASPLKRNVTIEDVGQAAVWLCSEGSRIVTGQTIYLDGGYSVMGLPLDALNQAEQQKGESKAD